MRYSGEVAHMLKPSCLNHLTLNVTDDLAVLGVGNRVTEQAANQSRNNRASVQSCCESERHCDESLSPRFPAAVEVDVDSCMIYSNPRTPTLTPLVQPHYVDGPPPLTLVLVGVP